MRKNYVFFEMSEIDKIDFSQILDTPNSLRKSIDGTKTFVKWAGEEVPECILNLKTKSDYMSIVEVLRVLDTEEWVNKIIVEFPF